MGEEAVTPSVDGSQENQPSAAAQESVNSGDQESGGEQEPFAGGDLQKAQQMHAEAVKAMKAAESEKAAMADRMSRLEQSLQTVVGQMQGQPQQPQVPMGPYGQPQQPGMPNGGYTPEQMQEAMSRAMSGDAGAFEELVGHVADSRIAKRLCK